MAAIGVESRAKFDRIVQVDEDRSRGLRECAGSDAPSGGGIRQDGAGDRHQNTPSEPGPMHHVPGFLGVAGVGRPEHGALTPVTQTFRSKLVAPWAD